MKNLNFNRFTKAKSLSVPELEKKSLNFDATTSEQSDWYVLFGDDFVLVVKEEEMTNKD